MRYIVGLVLDTNFGGQLLELAEKMPVWVCDSETNRATAEQFWVKNPESHPENGLTLFRADKEMGCLRSYTSLLDNIELHHGSFSHTPPVSELEIFGSPSRLLMKEALKEAGYEIAEIRGNYIRAIQARASRVSKEQR